MSRLKGSSSEEASVFGSLATAFKLKLRARLIRAKAFAELPMMACDRATARCLCVLVSNLSKFGSVSSKGNQSVLGFKKRYLL